MRAFILYLKEYWNTTSRPAFLITLLFVASLVAANYTVGIEQRIQAFGAWYLSLGGFFLFFSIVLALVWGLQYEWGAKGRPSSSRYFHRDMLKILVLSALYFSFKMIRWDLTPFLSPFLSPTWSHYALITLQSPLKLALLFIGLLLCRKAGWLEGSTF